MKTIIYAMTICYLLGGLLLNDSWSQSGSMQVKSHQPTTSNNNADQSNSMPSNEKIIYEYKKEDYFDFEALSVKGELLTPGDLSTKATKRVKFNAKKFVRKDFDEYIEDDLMEVY